MSRRSNPRPSLITARWAERLQKFIPSVQIFTFDWYSHEHVVYVKLHITLFNTKSLQLVSNASYVGRTSISIALREANRIAKYRQLERHARVKVEPALLYWHHCNNYHQFCTIPVWKSTEHVESLAVERSLIAIWCSQLNYRTFPGCFGDKR